MLWVIVQQCTGLMIGSGVVDGSDQSTYLRSHINLVGLVSDGISMKIVLILYYKLD